MVSKRVLGPVRDQLASYGVQEEGKICMPGLGDGVTSSSDRLKHTGNVYLTRRDLKGNIPESERL